MLLSDIEMVCLEGFRGRTKWNLHDNCFPILASYVRDISGGEDVGGIRHGTSTRRPCIRCVGTIEEFQAIQYEKAQSGQDMLESENVFLT